jgi:hypothetical protein
MSDLKQLDVLINNAGQLPTVMNTAIVAALANGVPFAAIQPVLTPLAKLSLALQAIQDWSTDAQKPGVTLYDGKPVTNNPDGTLLWGTAVRARRASCFCSDVGSAFGPGLSHPRCAGVVPGDVGRARRRGRLPVAAPAGDDYRFRAVRMIWTAGVGVAQRKDGSCIVPRTSAVTACPR